MNAVGLAARLGFAGKLPARGDFVARGLPRGFTEAWDAWLSEVMPGSRAILGEGWLDAWLEAPIWHFALPAGFCGPDAVAGVASDSTASRPVSSSTAIQAGSGSGAPGRPGNTAAMVSGQ